MMSGTGRIYEAADRIEAWFADVWPLWIDRGVDPANGLFVESLDLSGRPNRAAPRRVRVQGRQLYCLSRAIAAGHDARPQLERALDAVAATCWGREPGWIHVISADGAPLDPLRDSYDQAFLLFGLAGAYAAGLERARMLADATFDFIDAELTDATDGSVREGLPDSLPRRSNPHMHLLEALLAWHRLTGEQRHLERANRLALLFRDRFLDPDTGTLGEFFTADWRLAPGPDGACVEPGHHFEWSWLLHRLAEAGGEDLRMEAGIIHRWGLANGLDESGFAIDECDRDGRHRRRTRRSWPQTELIKSHLVNGTPDQAADVAIAVLDTYLSTDPAGLWIDQFDASGKACVSDVPASTLYHLVVAFEEVLRAAGRAVPLR